MKYRENKCMSKFYLFQYDLKDVCNYTNDEEIQLFSCDCKDQF